MSASVRVRLFVSRLVSEYDFVSIVSCFSHLHILVSVVYCGVIFRVNMVLLTTRVGAFQSVLRIISIQIESEFSV